MKEILDKLNTIESMIREIRLALTCAPGSDQIRSDQIDQSRLIDKRSDQDLTERKADLIDFDRIRGLMLSQGIDPAIYDIEKKARALWFWAQKVGSLNNPLAYLTRVLSDCPLKPPVPAPVSAPVPLGFQPPEPKTEPKPKYSEECFRIATEYFDRFVLEEVFKINKLSRVVLKNYDHVMSDATRLKVALTFALDHGLIEV